MQQPYIIHLVQRPDGSYGLPVSREIRRGKAMSEFIKNGPHAHEAAVELMMLDMEERRENEMIGQVFRNAYAMQNAVFNLFR